MPAYVGRFAPLVAFLHSQGDDQITLSFDAIATIVGRDLSPRDRAHSDRWSSRQYRYVRRWQALGWDARLDRHRQCVHFTRECPG